MIERLLGADDNSSTREKGLAGAFSALMIGAVLWPIVQNWREHPKDSFPLSYYPMFSLKRADATTVRYLVGVDSRGERHLLSHRYAGTGGLNQVRRQINKIVRGGKADTLAKLVAANVAERNEERYADVVTVQIISGRYRFADFFAGNREPIKERIHASCPVERESRAPLRVVEGSA